MSLRFLIGLLSAGLQDQRNDSDSIAVPLKEMEENCAGTVPGLIDFEGAAKLHIGMLTISLIAGLAYGGYVAYSCWTEKDVLLGYIRNLVIALVCRTFFSILFDGVVLLGTSCKVGGANTLTSFEQIFLNLVLGFWLNLTVYFHARMQRDFKSEPTLRLYQYGIPVVAAFFAFIWIFTLQDIVPMWPWWFIATPVSQWIVNSINLLLLLIQLALMVDMGRMMMTTKSSLDNDSVSLLWKVAAIMGTLVLIFWLQFGLSLGSYKTSQSYLYFFYLVDGLEGTLVCVCLFLFNKWVALFINNSCLSPGSEERHGNSMESNSEEFLPGGRGIVTIDSMFMTKESGRWRNSQEEETNDVVYSNVVDPHRLQKTLELYKRFNVIPSKVTVIDGETFYECQSPVENEVEIRKSSLSLIPGLKPEENKLKTEKLFEPIQKKNAFYTSKYLILDPKEEEFPKYLETRPSVSSMSERDSEREERSKSASLDARDLVKTWLNKNLETLQEYKKPAANEFGEPNGMFRSVSETGSQVRHQQAGIYDWEVPIKERNDISMTDEEFFRNFELLRKKNTQPEKIELNTEVNSSASKLKETARNAEIKPKTDEFKPSVQPEELSKAETTLKQPNEKVLPLIPTDSSTPKIDKTGRDEEIIKSKMEEVKPNAPSQPEELSKAETALKQPNEKVLPLIPADSSTPKIDKTGRDEEIIKSKMEEVKPNAPSQPEELSKAETALKQPNEKVLPLIPADSSTPKIDKTGRDEEITPTQPKEISKSETPSNEGNTEPTNKDDTEENNKQKELQFLTYSELLEFRRKRNNSDPDSLPDRKQSLSKSIFSTIESLFSIGGGYLTSIKGFSKEEEEEIRKPDIIQDFRTDEILQKQLQDDVKDDKQTELKQQEAIPRSDIVEKPTVDVEDNRSHPEGIVNREQNENEYDKYEKQMKIQELAEHMYFAPDLKRRIPNKHIDIGQEEPVISVKDDGRHPEDIKNREQLPENDAERNQFLEEIYDVPSKIQRHVQKDEKRSESKEEKLKPRSDLTEEPTVGTDNKNRLPERVKDGIQPVENYAESDNFKNQTNIEYFAREMGETGNNKRIVEPDESLLSNLRKDSLSTSSESEFSIDKRQSSSSEFSIERLSRSIKTPRLDHSSNDLPTSDLESQIDSSEKSELELNSEKRQSSLCSSSSSEFAIDAYCAKVMAATAQFQNQPSPLYSRKNVKSVTCTDSQTARSCV